MGARTGVPAEGVSTPPVTTTGSRALPATITGDRLDVTLTVVVPAVYSIKSRPYWAEISPSRATTLGSTGKSDTQKWYHVCAVEPCTTHTTERGTTLLLCNKVSDQRIQTKLLSRSLSSLPS